MDTVYLWLMVPAWLFAVGMPAARGVGYAPIIEQFGLLAVFFLAARIAELRRTGQLPTLRRGDAEYAVEFENESEVWDEND